MRIRMLRDALGSPDASNVYHYEAGKIYLASEAHQETGAYAPAPLPLSNRLAALMVAEGWAVDADAVSGTASAPESPAAAPVQSPAPVEEPASPPRPAPVVAVEAEAEAAPAASAPEKAESAPVAAAPVETAGDEASAPVAPENAPAAKE